MSSSVGDEVSKRRLEALTDAVLAIVTTLLVLEITVPQSDEAQNQMYWE